MVRDRYDVVIVGARIAGATLAALLGDAGLSVLLLDRAALPSTTCSTHFFRGAAMVAVLDRLEVLTEVLALGCPRLTHEWRYADGSADALDGPPQNPGTHGYCLSVRRDPLDHILAKRACRNENVTFLQRSTVTDVLRTNERVTGVVLRGGEQVRAKIVIGADGRHSILARKLVPRLQEGAPPYRALFYRYVKDMQGVAGSDPDAPEFSLLDDEIAYVFPSDGGMTCIALSVNMDTFHWMRHDLRSRFELRLDRHRGLAPRIRQARAVGRLLGCGPEASYVRVPSGPGWALVGDAALHQDPWSGLGIDMASVHATLLADAVLDWTAGTTGEREALETYRQRRDEHALSSFRSTVALAPFSAVEWG